MIEYQIKDQTIDNFQIPILVRKYKTKWWPKTDSQACGPEALEPFFSKYPQLCKSPSPASITKHETFLAKKQMIISQMTACTSEEEYDKLLEELNEVKNSTASPVDLSEDNDDFFTQAEM